LVALSRDVERATRRVAAIEEHAVDLDGLVRRLAEDIAVLTPDPDGDSGGLRYWLGADEVEQARADLGDLVDWVAQVYCRYPGSTLPSCWLWHPAAVEELWWLRNAHHQAYKNRGGSWREVADWHDRHRPGVARRISAALRDCDLARHAPDGDRNGAQVDVPPADGLDAIAEQWAAHRAAPTPSGEQLDAAERYDSAQHRSRR